MELILSTPYLSTYYRKNLNILYAEWSEIAKEMSQEDFKKHIIDFVSNVIKYGVRGFLINSQKGHFTMSIEVQEWHDAEIAPQYIIHQLKKTGFILPEKDFFASASIQQAFDETEAQKLQIRFFDNLKDAEAWISQ